MHHILVLIYHQIIEMISICIYEILLHTDVNYYQQIIDLSTDSIITSDINNLLVFPSLK